MPDYERLLCKQRTGLYCSVYAAAVANGMQNPQLVAKEAIEHFDREFKV